MPDLRRLEARMEPELAEKIYYELEPLHRVRLLRCAGCGTARNARGLRRRGRPEQDRPASGSIRATRAATTKIFYELIGDDDGVFGCMSLLGCHDVCPKQLPLSTQIASLRRKMVAMGCQVRAPNSRSHHRETKLMKPRTSRRARLALAAVAAAQSSRLPASHGPGARADRSSSSATSSPSTRPRARRRSSSPSAPPS
jgi:L-lactate utilization protein LutB